VDFGAYSVERDGESQGLSRKELDLLRFLLDHSGQTCARDSILDSVWGRDEHPTPRTIDNFIAKLRKKLEPEPESPRHLVTVHGVGYRLDP
jgi:DNA-binding response OmpR family regulator